MFGRKGKGRKVRSNNNRIVFVSEEHCDNLCEKYFTTLGRIGEEYDECYVEDDYPDEEYDGLVDCVKNEGQGWARTKYREIYVKEVTPENVQGITSDFMGDIGYSSPDVSYANQMEDDDYRGSDILKTTDDDLRYLGYTDAEIREARADLANGDPYTLISMFKEAWDPRYTPEDIYTRLEALGVPKKCYDPRYAPYRGCERGSYFGEKIELPDYIGSENRRSYRRVRR